MFETVNAVVEPPLVCVQPPAGVPANDGRPVTDIKAAVPAVAPVKATVTVVATDPTLLLNVREAE